MRWAVLMVFSLFTWPVPGTAQLPLQGPASSALFGYRQTGVIESAMLAPSDGMRRHTRPTYWKEGIIIGGALGVIGGAVLAHRLCGLAEESTEHCTGSSVLGGVLGAVLLAIPGALIGGQISKEPAKREHTE